MPDLFTLLANHAVHASSMPLDAVALPAGAETAWDVSQTLRKIYLA